MPLERTYSYYADQVKLCWSRAVAGILAMGYLLAEARMSLAALEWRRLVSEECPFDLSVACRLMRIAENQRVTDPQIQAKLPPSWHKIYELVTLPELAFRKALQDGIIRPGITGKEIARLRASEDREALPRPAPDPKERLIEAMKELLLRFPAVESLTARISGGKSEVVEISRRDLQRAA